MVGKVIVILKWVRGGQQVLRLSHSLISIGERGSQKVLPCLEGGIKGFRFAISHIVAPSPIPRNK